MTLVSTDWLNDNLDKVKIIDASWHLIKNRNAVEEYNKEHIENAIFFDLDKNSNQKKNLAHGHFLPSVSGHEKTIAEQKNIIKNILKSGIENDSYFNL